MALGPVGSRASSERVEAAALAVAKRKATRPRESSFSLDSDDDYYYSSPEDEEEFVCQEFIKEYNSVRTRSLVDMSKADLIKEYLQMEQRVDNLERRVDRHRGNLAEEEDWSSFFALDALQISVDFNGIHRSVGARPVRQPPSLTRRGGVRRLFAIKYVISPLPLCLVSSSIS